MSAPSGRPAKLARILDAVSRKDLALLRELAASRDGLVDDGVRRLVWPLLLHAAPARADVDIAGEARKMASWPKPHGNGELGGKVETGRRGGEVGTLGPAGVPPSQAASPSAIAAKGPRDEAVEDGTEDNGPPEGSDADDALLDAALAELSRDASRAVLPGSLDLSSPPPSPAPPDADVEDDADGSPPIAPEGRTAVLALRATEDLLDELDPASPIDGAAEVGMEQVDDGQYFAHGLMDPTFDTMSFDTSYRDQIRLDVDRSFVNWPRPIPAPTLALLRRNLTLVLLRFFTLYPYLHYYQGFHSLASSLLLVLGPDACVACLANLAHFWLRDHMRETMDGTVAVLELLPPLLRAADPDVGAFLDSLPNFSPFFPLPQLLTLFTHDPLPSTPRTLDLMLASGPLMPVYLSAAAVLARREGLLALEPDPSLAHRFLSEWPSWIPVEHLLRRARELCARHTPAWLMRHAGPALGPNSAPARWERDVASLPASRALDLRRAKRLHELAPRGTRRREKGGWGLGEQAGRAAAVGVLGVLVGMLLLGT
ncbi:hypothetical protein DFJ74DRAFT_711218 [Hyaloraphidium curvatum]|nr:hypothetical protein DFJ74DRAFT_711218 [Hyaloraphidium curvatum]